MNNAIQKLYDELQEDLVFYAESGAPPASRLGSALISIRSILIRLKVLVLSEDFAGEEAEINFFKNEKPLFVTEQLYLTEYATISLGKPTLNDELLVTYYTEELRRIQLFINRFGFLYHCYKLEASDLDRVLFLRDAEPSGLLLPENPDSDPNFSTSGGYLWAKFRAYERLQQWLIDEIGSLSALPNKTKQIKDEDNSLALKWTGGVVNLVELAYGLWLTGQFNNGDASITQIISWLEVNLNVKIGRAHRRWETIAARKRLSLTRFLEQMVQAIRKRLDDELSR